MNHRPRLWMPALAIVATLAGLSASAAFAKPAKPATLTDANIAAIVLAANTIDIDNGRLAVGKTSNDAVKAFANMMITDHTSVNDKAKALAAKLGLKPVPNATSRGLVKQMTVKRGQLARHAGAAFDVAYLDNEIAYHQAVLDMLDQTLVPGARNAELKDLLTSVRPAFVAHLEHAKQARAALAG